MGRWMEFENEPMSPACFPNSGRSRNPGRAKSPSQVARKSSSVTEKATSGTRGAGAGKEGREGGLGLWQFVCKQVTSWHSVG